MKNSPVMHPQVPEAGDSQKTKLLIPIDATEESRWAIHYAIRRARAGTSVEVYLLYIVEPVKNWEVLRFHTEQEVRQRFEERSAFFLEEAAQALLAAGIPCHRFSREDELVHGIQAFAEEKGCTEIVVPRLAFFGLFPYGIGAKLASKRSNVPVVLTTEDGSSEPE